MSNNKDVFVSYSHADSNFVHKIAEDLKSRGLNVWLDEWDIKPGANITKTINEGLKSSRYLLLFLSENSLKSRWVEEEWTSKFNDEVNKNKITVVPVLIDTVDMEDLPQFLSNKKIVNLSSNYDQTIEKTASYLLEEIRSHKEQQSLGPLKEILTESIGKSGRKSLLLELRRGIIRRLDMANSKGWSIERKFNILTREIEFAARSVAKDYESKEKDYKDDPSEFKALNLFLLSDDLDDVNKLKEKIKYIIERKGEAEEIFEEALLEIELIRDEEN